MNKPTIKGKNAMKKIVITNGLLLLLVLQLNAGTIHLSNLYRELTMGQTTMTSTKDGPFVESDKSISSPGAGLVVSIAYEPVYCTGCEPCLCVYAPSYVYAYPYVIPGNHDLVSQASTIDLIGSSLHVIAQGEVESPTLSSPMRSLGKVTITVDVPCSFALQATTVAPAGGARVTLRDGDTVLISVSAENPGIATTGTLSPHHTYALEYIAEHNAVSIQPSSYDLTFDLVEAPRPTTHSIPTPSPEPCAGNCTPVK